MVVFKGALKEAIKNTTLMMRKNYRSLKQIKENEKRWKKSGLRKKYGLSNYPFENLRFGTKCCSKIRTGSVLNKSEEDDSEELKNSNRVRPERVQSEEKVKKIENGLDVAPKKKSKKLRMDKYDVRLKENLILVQNNIL